MNKKQLSERDICTKYITPALRNAGWDEMTQLREEQRLHQNRDQIGADDVQFYVRHLPRLTTRREHIEGLRESILRMAVTGLLVPQCAVDATPRETLSAADGVRAEFAKQDRRADAGQQQLFLPDERWAIPPAWEWRGLADLVLFIDYRGQTPTKSRSGVKLITAKNVRKGVINSFPEEFVSEEQYTKWMTRGLPKRGDVLFSTEAPIGNAAVVDLGDVFALAQRVICFRGYGAIDPAFLVLQLLPPPFQGVLDKAATGLTAKGIKAAKLKRLAIAVPPLAEQHRIVAKVNDWTAACDQLGTRLEVIQSERRRLLDSTLHRWLATG